MKGVEYLILRFLLFLLFAIITMPVVIPLILLVEYLEAHEPFAVLGWFLTAVALAWLLCLPWLAHHTAQHMTFEDQNLLPAIKSAFYDLRLRLAFMPFVGHWFEPPSDKKDTDDGDS